MKKLKDLFKFKKLSSQLLAFCISIPVIIAVVLTVFAAIKVVDGYNKPSQTLSQTTAQSVIEKIDRNFYERFGDVQAFAYNRLPINFLENNLAPEPIKVLEPVVEKIDTVIPKVKKWTPKPKLVVAIATKTLSSISNTRNVFILDSLKKSTTKNDLQSFINTMTAYYVLYDLMMLVDKEGKVVAVNTLNKNGEPLQTKNLIGRDVYNTEWFRACMGAKGPEGGAWYSDFMINEDVAQMNNGNGYGVAFAATVKNDKGEPIGVWYNFASWSEVSQGIRIEAEQKLQQTEPEAFIALTDKEGKIIDYNDDKVINNMAVDSMTFSKNSFALDFKGTKITNSNYIASFAKGIGAYTYKGKGWHAVTFIPIKKLGFATFISKDLLPLIIFVLCAIAFAIWITRWFSKKTANRILDIKTSIDELAKGNLVENTNTSIDEIGQMSRSVNNLTSNLANIRTFADEVGKGNFDSEMVVFNNQGDLGTSLANMRTGLKDVSEDAIKRNWINQGMANFGSILRNDKLNIEQNCQQMILYAVKYVHANQGALFFVSDDEATKTECWEMMACAAYDKIRFVERKSGIEEGLLGRIWLEKEYLYFTDVPQNYVHITSGIGDATPGCLIIIPLKTNDKVVGAIEIAAFNPFKEQELDFLLKIADSIAATVNTIKVNDKTTRLLEHTQFQAESMKAQEEELRQNLEELSATQEEMQIKMNESEGLREKSLEAELKASKLANVVNNADNAITIMDSNGHIEFINEAFTKLTGFELEELLGKNLESFVVGNETSKETLALLNTNLSKGLAFNGEIVFYKKDRSFYWSSMSIKPIFENGRLVNTISLQTDITNIKKIAEDNACKLSAIDNFNGTIEFEMDGTIITANAIFTNLMKYDLKEIVGKHHSIFVPNEYKNSIEYKEFWQKLGRGESISSDFTRVDKTGKKVYLKGTYAIIFDDRGNPKRVIKYATDITAQKELSDDFVNQMRAVNSINAVIEFDLKGYILKANDTFCKTMGYDLEEIVGKHHRMFVDSVFANSSEYLQMWTDLANDKNISGEFKRIKKDNSIIWLKATYAGIKDGDGVSIKVVKYAQDITESKKMLETSLQQREELLAQEEELRQNLEELSAIQEDMNVKEQIHLNKIIELEQKLLNNNK